jgi:putative tryptophan/tyrosine transport system substrate-binding protein
MLGQSKTYDELAAELAGLTPDAIVVVGTPPALAAKRQTTTIPIILAPAADPVRTGLVRSLSRPGGNVTGISLYGSEIARKRMEIFKEAVVGIQRIAVLGNAENPLHRFLWNDLQPIAPALGLQFRLFVVSGLDKLPAVFSTIKQEGFDAVTLLSDAQFFSARPEISSFAATHRLPAMYESRESVDDGGLISYGANISDLTRRAAKFVVRVINGARAGDLPVEQPTKFDLVIISRPPGRSASASRIKCLRLLTRWSNRKLSHSIVSGLIRADGAIERRDFVALHESANGPGCLNECAAATSSRLAYRQPLAS